MGANLLRDIRWRTFSLIALLVLAAVLVSACGGGTAVPTPTSAPKAVPTVASAPAPTVAAQGAPTVAPVSGGDAAAGATLFAAKCSSCHNVGGGAKVGPDLQGVNQRRDRTWLINWITGPDKLVASGDPIAKQLVQQYGQQMPNLGITATQAADLLAYIQSKS
jgi:mono/diheme cytochrome c family protein